MKLRLLYHGHCFDGVASAATFTRFYKERIHPEAEVNYTGLLHRPGNLFDLAMFDSDENAIVDFKYAASEKLTWWFDHHESAFLTPEDEAHFRADKSGQKFLDATRKSCTEFIADVAHERFGFNPEPIKSLVHWAHIIDGALYESPAQCVELKEPALQLMQVIEADPDDAFIEQNHSRADDAIARRGGDERGSATPFSADTPATSRDARSDQEESDECKRRGAV